MDSLVSYTVGVSTVLDSLEKAKRDGWTIINEHFAPGVALAERQSLTSPGHKEMALVKIDEK